MGGERRAVETRSRTLTTVLVMVCTAASRLFGYVRQALISIYFGDAGAADAMNAVFTVPNNLRKLFAEGAFSSAFIPVLSSTIEEDPSGRRSRDLVRTLFAFQLVVLVPLVGLSLVFPASIRGPADEVQGSGKGPDGRAAHAMDVQLHPPRFLERAGHGRAELPREVRDLRR